MTGLEIAIAIACWAVGWLVTAVGMFRNLQQRFPTIAKEMRSADASAAALYCLVFWPGVALFWLLGRGLGAIVRGTSNILPGGRA